jgi:hypothetical protein
MDLLGEGLAMQHCIDRCGTTHWPMAAPFLGRQSGTPAFARARLTEPGFRDLRVAQILSGIHTNSATVEAMDEIFKARQEMLGAVNDLNDGAMEEEGLAPEQLREVRGNEGEAAPYHRREPRRRWKPRTYRYDLDALRCCKGDDRSSL